ncbi:MAG: histidine ammonia-lyase [Deltaproteobacteria bacterium]|nr:histidine ammonia-lyase [Deltaproteobacteria bacterium]
MKQLLIDGKSLSLEDIARVAYDLDAKTKVKLSPAARGKVQQSRKFIESKLGGRDAIYGVNTGFGLMSRVRIDDSQLDRLQVNLLRSHATGIGRPLSESETRAAILLRANTLAAGHSGVSVALIEALLALLNASVHPWIPEQGSVGACGDLAPLAHLALTLIGEGRAYHDGKLMPSARALEHAGLKPYKVLPKEGLSLINGTQIMTAIGTLVFLRAEALAQMADVAGAMTIEALAGSVAPFDEDIHRIRPHRGQGEVAAHMRKLLARYEIMKSHEFCDKVQDPYSLRCIPQVHGIARDVLRHVREVLEVEVNSVTDNPLVFAKGAKGGKIVNGGNFHGEYVAIAMDELCIAVSELANISERRLEKLINPALSDLPAFLVKEGGLNSGFMIVQVAAASLVSENKVLSHPASVDSIPTSADKEDHVSMGTIAARKARSIVENTWNVIAMEFFGASQGLEFRRPLRASKLVDQAYRAIRERVPPVEHDRAFYEDINTISDVMNRGELLF